MVLTQPSDRQVRCFGYLFWKLQTCDRHSTKIIVFYKNFKDYLANSHSRAIFDCCYPLSKYCRFQKKELEGSNLNFIAVDGDLANAFRFYLRAIKTAISIVSLQAIGDNLDKQGPERKKKYLHKHVWSVGIWDEYVTTHSQAFLERGCH